MCSQFFQVLESRTFLSATPVHTDPSPSAKLAADKAMYQKDIQQFVTDSTLMNQTLAADKAKVAADCTALQNSKTNFTKKLSDDTSSMLAALKADSAAGTPTFNKWQPILAADQAQIKADHEHPDLVKKDQAKYTTDYNASRAEMAPYEALTKADIAKWNAILAADKTACATVTTVVTAATKDAKGVKSVKGSVGEEVNPLITQLKTDQAKLAADQASFTATLKADQLKINADIAQMKKDGGGDVKPDGDKK